MWHCSPDLLVEKRFTYDVCNLFYFHRQNLYIHKLMSFFRLPPGHNTDVNVNLFSPVLHTGLSQTLRYPDLRSPEVRQKSPITWTPGQPRHVNRWVTGVGSGGGEMG